MKKFNMLKKIKLNTPQMFLVILVILVIVFGFTNLFCNTLGLGKKCNIKENYAVRTSDCATGPACSSSTGDYADTGITQYLIVIIRRIIRPHCLRTPRMR